MLLPYRETVYSEKNLTGKFCSQPWENININNNGEVYSCYCQDWTSLLLGNILETSLEEIYNNNENLNKLRSSVMDGKFGWCKVGHCGMLDSLPSVNDDTEKYKNSNDFQLPVSMHLGIDDNCNLKCGICRGGLIFKNTENPITEKILSSLMNSYKNFNRNTLVYCDGSGDLFTSKSWEKFLYSTEMPHCWKLVITTNGNLLSKRKAQLQSIRENIHSVTISLDASTYNTYKIVRGGDWNILMDGVETVKELNIPINFQFVLQRENYQDLLGYKEIANQYGAYYGLQMIDKRDHMSDAYWNHNRIEDNLAVDYAKLKEDLTILKSDRRCGFDGGTAELLKKL